jgi:hypothetical protein
MGIMEFTLLNFFKLITGHAGTLGKYVQQNKLALALSTKDITNPQESKISNIVNEKIELTEDYRDEIHSLYQKNILEILTLNKYSNDLLNLCNAVNTMSNIPDDIKQSLTELIKSGTKIKKEDFNILFERIIDYLTVPELQPVLSVPQEDYSMIIDKCKQEIGKQIEEYISSNIYVQSDVRTENISFSDDENQIFRKIYHRVEYINSTNEEFIFKMSRLVERTKLAPGDDVDFFKSKFVDLCIKINDKEVSIDYTNKDICFCKKRHDHRNLLENWLIGLNITLSEEDYKESFTVEIEYTSIESFFLDRLLESYRTKYPCYELKHTCNIKTNSSKEYILSILPFEVFYNINLTKGKRNAATVNQVDKTTATVNFNNFTLPGTGYTRRILLKDPVDVDDLKTQ